MSFKEHMNAYSLQVLLGMDLREVERTVRLVLGHIESCVVIKDSFHIVKFSRVIESHS